MRAGFEISPDIQLARGSESGIARNRGKLGISSVVISASAKEHNSNSEISLITILSIE